MSIHPSAHVAPGAQLGSGVTIGPFAVIEDDTVIGDNCVVEAAGQVRRGSRLGPGCFVGSGAIVGADPQFRGFDRSIASGVSVGRNNVLREYVTVHRSIHPLGVTSMGEGNFLMAGAHVGHDATVGNDNTLANNVLLAGHVELGSRCFLGGGSVFHQFVRIGDHVLTQGNSGFSLDLPPYVIGADINIVVGVNLVGLRRCGFESETIRSIKGIFREVFLSDRPLREILAEKEGADFSPEITLFLDFLRKESKKGPCRRVGRGGER